jgi:hypothetical protein
MQGTAQDCEGIEEGRAAAVSGTAGTGVAPSGRTGRCVALCHAPDSTKHLLPGTPVHLRPSDRHAPKLQSAWSPPKGVGDDAGVTLHTIIVDSGSTFTYLASDVLKSLKQQLKTALAPLAPPPRAVPDAPRRLGLGRLLLRRLLARGLRQARPRPPEGAAPNAAASDAYSDDDHLMSSFQTSPQQPDAAGAGRRGGSG